MLINVHLIKETNAKIQHGGTEMMRKKSMLELCRGGRDFVVNSNRKWWKRGEVGQGYFGRKREREISNEEEKNERITNKNV